MIKKIDKVSQIKYRILQAKGLGCADLFIIKWMPFASRIWKILLPYETCAATAKIWKGKKKRMNEEKRNIKKIISSIHMRHGVREGVLIKHVYNREKWR